MPIELEYALPAPFGLLPNPNLPVFIPPFFPQLIPHPWGIPVSRALLPPGSQSAIQQQSVTQTCSAMGPHLPIGAILPFGPMVHLPIYPLPLPFAMLPQPPMLQPSFTQGHVRGRGGGGHPQGSSRSRRSIARMANRSRAGSARGRSSPRPARLVPQQPSNRPPTPEPSEGSSPKTQTITTSEVPMIQEAPKTPPKQRDPSPNPSPTSGDLEVLAKTTGFLTI
ncbi:hypothetical protein F4814DRAFT_460101 [Daldinia grandis]|nr:hypothetical protein F4814DRAFT_460101 [Daldinia grandis]